jgi:hypothetical protein
MAFGVAKQQKYKWSTTFNGKHENGNVRHFTHHGSLERAAFLAISVAVLCFPTSYFTKGAPRRNVLRRGVSINGSKNSSRRNVSRRNVPLHATIPSIVE